MHSACPASRRRLTPPRRLERGAPQPYNARVAGADRSHQRFPALAASRQRHRSRPAGAVHLVQRAVHHRRPGRHHAQHGHDGGVRGLPPHRPRAVQRPAGGRAAIHADAAARMEHRPAAGPADTLRRRPDPGLVLPRRHRFERHRVPGPRRRRPVGDHDDRLDAAGGADDADPDRVARREPHRRAGRGAAARHRAGGRAPRGGRRRAQGALPRRLPAGAAGGAAGGGGHDRPDCRLGHRRGDASR